MVRQLSVFLDNRVGQLLRLAQIVEQKHIEILGLSVIDSVDCAVVRLLVDVPDVAKAELVAAGFAVSVAEIIVVRLPPGTRGLLAVWQCLLSSEINIAYCYPLLPASLGPTVALSVDSPDIAVDSLTRHKFEVLGEADLGRGL